MVKDIKKKEIILYDSHYHMNKILKKGAFYYQKESSFQINTEA